MKLFRLSPLTQRQLRRFRQMRRGYYSLLALGVIFVLSLAAEGWINSRALVVRYEGELYFPFLEGFHPGTQFGQPQPSEADYRALNDELAQPGVRGFVIMPLIPYNPYEDAYPADYNRPRPPNWSKGHYLGTDRSDRDILARLVYGYRSALLFGLLYCVGVYALGVSLGSVMGYFGGWTDLIGQRLVEVWSIIPFLQVVLIINAIVRPSLTLLLVITVVFGWTGMTYYTRAAALRERARDYVAAAQVIGARPSRIILRHILPNTAATLITFAPFTVSGAIAALTALDYLGYGLRPPAPTLGEMLSQGRDYLGGTNAAPWILLSAFFSIVILLSLVTFVGEALREAFDPKKFTIYR